MFGGRLKQYRQCSLFSKNSLWAMSLHSLISVSKLYEHKVIGLNHLEDVIEIEISFVVFWKLDKCGL